MDKREIIERVAAGLRKMNIKRIVEAKLKVLMDATIK